MWQGSGMQFSVVQCPILQFHAVQGSAVQYKAVHCSAAQCFRVLVSTRLCSAGTQYSVIKLLAYLFSFEEKGAKYKNGEEKPTF